MSERDELMDIMRDNMSAEYENELRAAADQILAAGYQRERFVSTPEEACKLLRGTWIRDREGWVAMIGDNYLPHEDMGEPFPDAKYPIQVLWDAADGTH